MVKIQIVKDEEMEKADFVICCPLPDPKYFEGNIETICSFCGVGIYHRPYMPKKPPKICLDCGGKLKND